MVRCRREEASISPPRPAAGAWRGASAATSFRGASASTGGGGSTPPKRHARKGYNAPPPVQDAHAPPGMEPDGWGGYTYAAAAHVFPSNHPLAGRVSPPPADHAEWGAMPMPDHLHTLVAHTFRQGPVQGRPSNSTLSPPLASPSPEVRGGGWARDHHSYPAVVDTSVGPMRTQNQNGNANGSGSGGAINVNILARSPSQAKQAVRASLGPAAAGTPADSDGGGAPWRAAPRPAVDAPLLEQPLLRGRELPPPPVPEAPPVTRQPPPLAATSDAHAAASARQESAPAPVVRAGPRGGADVAVGMRVPEPEAAVYNDQVLERDIDAVPQRSPPTTVGQHYASYQHNLYRMAQEILGQTHQIREEIRAVSASPTGTMEGPPAPPVAPTHTPDPTAFGVCDAGHEVRSTVAPTEEILVATEVSSTPAAPEEVDMLSHPATEPRGESAPAPAPTLHATSSFVQMVRAEGGGVDAPTPRPSPPSNIKQMQDMAPMPSVKSISPTNSALAPTRHPPQAGLSLRSRSPAKSLGVRWAKSPPPTPPAGGSSSSRPAPVTDRSEPVQPTYPSSKRIVAAGPRDRPASLWTAAGGSLRSSSRGPVSAASKRAPSPAGVAKVKSLSPRGRTQSMRSYSPGAGPKVGPGGGMLLSRPAPPPPAAGVATKTAPFPQLSASIARGRSASPAQKGPPRSGSRPMKSAPLGRSSRTMSRPAQPITGSVKSAASPRAGSLHAKLPPGSDRRYAPPPAQYA